MDIYQKLGEKYGAVALPEKKELSPLELALQVRQKMRRADSAKESRCLDLTVIKEEFQKINHDLEIYNGNGGFIKGIMKRLGKEEKPFYRNEEISDRIHETFRDFSEYVKHQLTLNESTHADLLNETAKVQAQQIDLLKKSDSLSVRLSETTSLLEEATMELDTFKGKRMDADSAEKRALLKRYLDNLMRDQDNQISEIMNSYDMLSNIEETLLVLDFYKELNNMVNIGQRAALGEARVITEEYARNKDILGRIKENADFALQVYKTIDIVKGHVEKDFMQSRDAVVELKKSYDERISDRRRDKAKLKQERLSMLRGFDDSFMRRALEYKNTIPTYN